MREAFRAEIGASGKDNIQAFRKSQTNKLVVYKMVDGSKIQLLKRSKILKFSSICFSMYNFNAKISLA